MSLGTKQGTKIMADYLLQRPSGYYFRYTLLIHLRDILGQREIIYSLRTTSRLVAKSKAAYIADSIKQLAERLNGSMVVADSCV